MEIEQRKKIIRKEIAAIMCNNFNIEKESLESNFDLDSLGLNSIDALEMLILLENEFHIEIKDEDLNSELFSNIEYLTEYIYSNVEDEYFGNSEGNN